MKKLICITLLFLICDVNAQDNDVKTYYAKKWMVVYKLINGDSKEETVFGKNVTIKYDEILKSITIHYTSSEGTESRVRYFYKYKSRIVSFYFEVGNIISRNAIGI